jgi:hypothetical protein
MCRKSEGVGVARRFVRSAPSKVDRQQLVDLRVADMTAGDARWWDTRVGPKHAPIATRADRFWSWSVLLPLCHVVQRARRRYCRPLVIWARTDDGRFVRVGMSILIEGYPYLDVAHRGDSHFLWFMSAADAGVLMSEFGLSHPPALGRVLVDNAIVLSQNAGLGGRMGLHAAASGGDTLLKVYERCGLLMLPPAAELPPPIRRPNDGRYFYAGETLAETLAAALDASR